MRLLTRHPGFSAAFVTTMSLGVGGLTALFALVHGVLLRPPPYPDPRELAFFHWTGPEGTANASSGAKLAFWQEGSRAFEGIAAADLQSAGSTLAGSDRAEYVRSLGVSAGFFRTLGITPVLGREILPAEDRGGACALVLSEGLWKRAFGGAVSVIAFIPAFRMARSEVQTWLRPAVGGHLADPGLGGRRLGRLLVAGQVALSLAVATGAWALAEGLLRLRAVDPGFSVEDVWTLEVPLSARRHATAGESWRFSSQLRERLLALPGVRAVATASSLPLATGLNVPVEIDGTSEAGNRGRVPGRQCRVLRVPAHTHPAGAPVAGRRRAARRAGRPRQPGLPGAVPGGGQRARPAGVDRPGSRPPERPPAPHRRRREQRP